MLVTHPRHWPCTSGQCLDGWVFVVHPVLVWGLGYSQRVRNGLCLQGHFSGVSNPFLYTCCWHARLVTRDFSPMFLRLAVPVTVMYLFQFSKKILTLDLKQDPPPHPNTLRLQRMIRYSATLFVQVKPSWGGRNTALTSPALLPLWRETGPMACLFFVCTFITF